MKWISLGFKLLDWFCTSLIKPLLVMVLIELMLILGNVQFDVLYGSV